MAPQPSLRLAQPPARPLLVRPAAEPRRRQHSAAREWRIQPAARLSGQLPVRRVLRERWPWERWPLERAREKRREPLEPRRGCPARGRRRKGRRAGPSLPRREGGLWHSNRSSSAAVPVIRTFSWVPFSCRDFAFAKTYQDRQSVVSRNTTLCNVSNVTLSQPASANRPAFGRPLAVSSHFATAALPVSHYCVTMRAASGPRAFAQGVRQSDRNPLAGRI